MHAAGGLFYDAKGFTYGKESMMTKVTGIGGVLNAILSLAL
jgi:hypothetical protein